MTSESRLGWLPAGLATALADRVDASDSPAVFDRSAAFIGEIATGPVLARAPSEDPTMRSFDRTLPTALSLLALTGLLGACGADFDDSSAEDGDGISLPDEGDTGANDELPELPDDPPADDDGPTCSTTTTTTITTPPDVMLVLDKSRSMINYTWDDDGLPQTPEVTRWASLHATVASITSDYEASMNLGLTLFPSVDATGTVEGGCMVALTPDVDVGPGNAAAILAAIPAADSLELYGATPAASGIATALAHLESVAGERPAAMILVTDGAANCGLGAEGLAKFDSYDEDLPLLVADAWDRVGIPTFVVGIDIQDVSEHPFTNPREKLDELAQLGGAPRAGDVGFYDTTSADQLTAALDEIAAKLGCTVELGKAPSAPDQLVVSVGGQPLERLDSCDEGDGWVYSDPDGGLERIELCQAACEAMVEVGEVEAEFLCPLQP